jgi:tetratricopeptide (TPR) repeat protein
MSLKIDRLISKAKKLIKKAEIKEAIEIYTEILQISPSNQEAKRGLQLLSKVKFTSPSKEQINSIMKLFSKGQFKNTLNATNALIKDYPNDSLLFNICGACYNETNELQTAIESFEKAIAIKPDYAEAHYNLGVAFHKTRQLESAVKSYETAIKIKQAYPTAQNNLGLIYLEFGQLDLAVKKFEWAIAYSPEYAEAHNSLGAAYQELKQFDKAKIQFEKASSLNPQYAQAFENLGILCEIINLSNEALNFYEKAIQTNPNLTNSYRNLSRLKKFKAKDPLISQMQSILSKGSLSLSGAANINFALAKVYADLDNHEKYFKFLNEGNALRKKVLNYDINDSQNFHATVVKLFKSNKILNSNSQLKPLIKKPIFIVGMPRSGTTLVEQIISSHNDVHGGGELVTLSKIIEPILANITDSDKGELTSNQILSIRDQYLSYLSDLNVPEKIITDKMPVNFRFIGFILSAFPEAKIIHLKRDARAICWSNYKNYFSTGNGFSFNQDDLIKFYSLYSEIMDFWHSLFPNKIYDINYEKLTTNQEKETQKLLNYCELDWDDDCLNFHKNTRPIVTASKSQVRQKMYQGSSEVWKKYELHLKTLIEGLKSY